MIDMRLTANTPSTTTSKAIKAKPRKARGAIFRLRKDIERLSIVETASVLAVITEPIAGSGRRHCAKGVVVRLTSVSARLWKGFM
jgi:hypothetical protein